MKFVNQLDAHHKLYFSLGAALAVFLLSYGYFSHAIQLIVSWLAYCLTSLTLSWITILSSHPAEVKKEVQAQDTGKNMLFLFAVLAALASLVAILILLQSISGQTEDDLMAHILLSLASVVGSWCLVHTIFTLRYAHLYYNDYTHENSRTKSKPGGLEFPGDQEPDYLDFAYFSFVVGMTFQVSDVEITSRQIRRLTLAHGILSFVFNTVIVALSINIVSGLIQK